MEMFLLCELGSVRGLSWRKLCHGMTDQVTQIQCRLFIWRSCRFVGALMRSLCTLPGGIGRL